MNNKKGQAASEFLATYGWAIMSVLLIMGAVAYWGLQKPSIPNTCIFQTEMACLDTQGRQGNTLQLAVKYNFINPIKITNIRTSEDCILQNYTINKVNVNQEDILAINLNCQTLTSPYKIDVYLDYQHRDSDFEGTYKGKLTGQ